PDADERPQVEGTLRAPWKWEEYLVEAAVIGGRDRWLRRLRGLAAELRLPRDALAAAGTDSTFAQTIEPDLEQPQHLQPLALAAGLDTKDERAQRERLRLRLAIGAATRRVVLSYPRMEVVEGRPRVPSFYGLDLMRAARGALPGYEMLERDAAEAGEARLAWPAPREPARAIDPIEHDLAVLGELLDMGEAARGRGRYLLELSGELHRSLTSRYCRWRPKWTPQDGLVRATQELEPILAQHRPSLRAYSATGLQRFATCPYQFLLASIHRLAPRREAVPLIQMDPLTRGSLLHEIQAATLGELRAAGVLPVKPERFERAVEALGRATEAIAPR